MVAAVLAILGTILVATDLLAVQAQQSEQKVLLQQWRAIQAAAPAPTATLPPEVSATPAPAVSPASPSSRPAPAAPAIDFLLRVPKLGYQAVVREGVSLSVLSYGPGHYPETPMPSNAGNVGIAAHNTYWLNWDRLAPGDQVIVETRGGSFVYRIDSRRVTSPGDRTPLAQDPSSHRLTMTTCWPLWAGAFATQRLVFFATEVGGVS